MRKFAGIIRWRGWLAVMLLAGWSLSAAAEGETIPFDGFKYRARMTATGNTSGSTVLADMPVLVRLSASQPTGFDYAVAGENGENIRFFASDGSPLHHEIDEWHSDGTSLVWVKLPQLTGTATSFYIAWGVRAATTPHAVDPTAVWNKYVAVWHCNETNYVARDSTVNHIEATNAAQKVVQITGKNGTAAFSSGDGGGGFSCGVIRLASGQPAPLTSVSSFAVSGWWRLTSNVSEPWQSFVSKGQWSDTAGDTILGWTMNTQGSYTGFTVCGGGSDCGTVEIPTLKNNWRYLTAVYDNDSSTTYVDGSKKDPRSLVAAKDTSRQALIFGGSLADFDEIRIRNGVPLAAEAVADYNIQNNAAFLSYSPAEALAGLQSNVVIAVSVNGGIDVGGTISDTADADTVDVYCAVSETEGEFEYERIATGITFGESFVKSVRNLEIGDRRYWSVIISNAVEGAEFSGECEFVFNPQHNFHRCCQLSVPGYTKSATLTRFPVLVRLAENSPSGFSYEDCAADGSDLRFYDENGDLIPHEIDTWNAAGESCIWVRLPQLRNGGVTFTMYWSPGRRYAAPSLPSTDVWVDYVGVWHFSEASGTAYDSTANHFDGANASAGAVIETTIAKVGSSRKLVGTGFSTGIKQLTSASHPQPLANQVYLSCSGWMRSSTSGEGYRGLFVKGGWANNSGWYMNTQNNTTQMTMIGYNKDTLTADITNVYNNWDYFDIVYNNTSYVIYCNGASKASSTGKSGARDNTSYALSFASGLTGYVDEFRIRNGATTAERAWADYQTQVSASFVTFGGTSVINPLMTIENQSVGSGNALSFTVRFGSDAEPGDRVVVCRGRAASDTPDGWEFSEEVATLASGAGETVAVGAYPGYGDTWNFVKVYLLDSEGSVCGWSAVMERHCEPRGTVGEIVPTATSATIPFTLTDAGDGSSVADVYVSCVESGSVHQVYRKMNEAQLIVGGELSMSLTGLPIYTDVEYSLLLVNDSSYTGRVTGVFKTLAVVASGGTTIIDALDGSGDKVHKFTATGSATFTMPAEYGGRVSYLVVGGGGGGGYNGANGGAGGGGGGGGFVEGSIYLDAGESLTLTVGAGGGSTSKGGDSKIVTLDGTSVALAIGGGYGNCRGGAGGAGGNGGGGGGRSGSVGGASTQLAPDGETIIGYAGGSASSSSFDAGGGGGGAGGPGQPGGTYDGVKRGGNGGDGAPSTITGERVFYAAGGGGGSGQDSSGTIAGLGGRGGGGNGQASGQTQTAGAANTGSGGAGTRGYGSGTSGGSGIVILRYTPVSGYQSAGFSIENVKCTTVDIVCSIEFLAYSTDKCSASIRLGDRYGELGAPIVMTNNWTLADGSFTNRLENLIADTEYRYEITFSSEHGSSVTTGEFTTPKDVAVGGDYTYELDDGSVVHLFRNTGSSYTFTTPSKPITAEFLMVGGGGGGGANGANGGAGGGGGGGGVLTGAVTIAANSTVTVTVGAGGISSSNGGSTIVEFASGAIGDEIVTWTALGGGGGRRRGEAGYSGANGGGGGGRNGQYGGAGTQTNFEGVVIGHSGGRAMTSGFDAGGGGGGASENGQNGGTYDGVKRGGNGGDGVECNITGESCWYGGGGGGGSGQDSSGTIAGKGGRGGGGNGEATGQGISVGKANTGGGGGGSRGYGNGAVGGSGVVVLRYRPSGYSARTTFELLDKGQSYVKVRATLSSVGDGGTSADWYIAWERDGEAEAEYVQVGTNAVEGTSVEYLITGLDPLQECHFRAKMVTDVGKTVYSGKSFAADEGKYDSTVPILENVSVALTDPLNGIVTCSARAPWGGDGYSTVALKLKYGRQPGVYTRCAYLDGPDLGDLSGSAILKSGRWYCVLVGESAKGESVPAKEYLITSQYSKYTIFYVK